MRKYLAMVKTLFKQLQENCKTSYGIVLLVSLAVI